MVHKIDLAIRQKLGEKVDIAVRTHFAPCGRPGGREFPNLAPAADLRQLGLIGLDLAELERAAHFVFPMMLLESVRK
jgi:hypothetical protein